MGKAERYQIVLNQYRDQANGILNCCEGNESLKVKPWPKGYPPEQPVYLDNQEQDPAELSEKGLYSMKYSRFS